MKENTLPAHSKKKRKHKTMNLLIFIILCLFGIVFIFPIFMMVANSFMGEAELMENYGAVLTDAEGKTGFQLFPLYPTLKPYVELLIDSPGFYVMFWNSCKQVFPILAGQLLTAVPAAWALGRFRFRGRKTLHFIYMMLMIMPFQVTMVSSYLVLSKLQLLDTHLAIILPGVFSAFPVFIMTKFFRSIPEALIEAAKIDGASELRIFLQIGIPLGYPGIVSAMILDFLECWNTIEQPMTFLSDKKLWPLSLYLPEITTDKMSVSFVASVIMMIPAILLFLYGQRYLEQGIAASGLKE